MNLPNRKYEFETLFFRCLAFATALVLCFVAISGCTSSKNVQKTETFMKREQVEFVNTVDKKDSVKVSIEEKIKTNDNTIEFFHPFDFMVDTSGCPTIEPKIIYKADGSFEATGVKKVNLKSTEWQKKYDSLNNEYNLEINRRMSLEEQIKGKVVNKEKETRPVAVAWLLFLVIGFITGFYAKYRLK